MDTLIIMLKNVLIFVLLAVPGYLLTKNKLLKPQESGTFSKLLTNLGMPFLILSSTMKLEFTGSFTISLVAMGIIGLSFTFLMFFLSTLFVRFEKEEKRKGMLRFAMIFANNGFIGIPLARAVFGEGSVVMAYMIVLNIIMNITLFTLGIYLISGDKNAINLKKAFLTPVFLSFLIGIGLNLMGVCKAVPELLTYSNHLSGIVTPLSMVVLGMKLAEVPMKRLFTTGRMYYVSLVKLVIFPALGALIMYLLQWIPGLGMDADAVIAFFVAFAMPTAGLASVLSDQHNGDTENAVIFTLGTTILSAFAIPVLYWLLCTLL
jgi:predicted permease